MSGASHALIGILDLKSLNRLYRCRSNFLSTRDSNDHHASDRIAAIGNQRYLFASENAPSQSAGGVLL